ncbi:MAG: ribonuclease R [Myxococcota bacterium]
MRSGRGRPGGRRPQGARRGTPPEPHRKAPELSGHEAVGLLHVHPAGYAFLEREEGGGDDLFVPASARGSALDGDRVRIAIVMGTRGPEGRVRDVLARGRAKLTGLLRVAGAALVLEPDDPRIGGVIAIEGGTGGGRAGQAVLAEITEYPRQLGGPMQARVLRVLGEPEDPRTEVAKVLALAGIDEEFPGAVQDEAQEIPGRVRGEDIEGREDLRHVPLLTIDPPDARDHDDAVAVERRGDGWRLWVAIADVSHYVRPGSAVDREARVRGNSVYLPDRAIPMLPERLSSGLCSLVEEERLAMVARIDFDAKGREREAHFCDAVVRPRAILDYDSVAAERLGEHAAHVGVMRALAAALRTRRSARGSLDFDLPEAKVRLHDDDPLRVRDVVRVRATPELRAAYGLIEEFMLAANEAVARFFAGRRLDAIWRVHDRPSEERISEFSGYAEALGEPFAAKDVTPLRLRQFLERLKGRPAERALSMLLLRALAQAQYSVVNVGHFGLAARHYVHFTSPIRRYPDLQVHRLLKAYLGLPAAPPAPTATELATIAADCSRAERRAMEAEREIVDLYCAYLMRDRIGDEFDGAVTGVAAFGLFVQLESPFVDGLVRVESLADDFYDFDEERMQLCGRKSGKRFSLGDALRVRVENVSVARRKVELVPAWLRERPEGAPRPPARPRRRRG